MEKSKDTYWEMGYQNGLKIGQTLSERSRQYVKEVNKAGHRKYEEGNRTQGVSVVMDSFRGGATIEEIVEKLVKLPTWRDKNKALKYVNKLVAELESKTYPYWFGWLLTREGNNYFLKEVSPAELCYAKFAEANQLHKIPQESKGVFIKGWVDGLLKAIEEMATLSHIGHTSGSESLRRTEAIMENKSDFDKDSQNIETGNSDINLDTDVFRPVVARLRERIDSLLGFKRFSSGIEAWLKVEVVAALGEKVEGLQNKGPDLLLQGGQQIELKAATDLSTSWICGGALKYGVPCLFLGDGGNASKIEALKRHIKIKLIAHEILSDGKSEWIIGIIVPSSQ